MLLSRWDGDDQCLSNLLQTNFQKETNGCNRGDINRTLLPHVKQKNSLLSPQAPIKSPFRENFSSSGRLQSLLLKAAETDRNFELFSFESQSVSAKTICFLGKTLILGFMCRFMDEDLMGILLLVLHV